MVGLSRVKFDWKRLFTYAIVGLLIGLGYAIWRAGNEVIPQPSTMQEIKTGKVEGRRAQFSSWEFRYDRATTLSDQITQQIEGVHEGVYYRNRKPFVRMHADRIEYNSVTHDFTIEGNAHFEVDDKGKIRTLDTQTASWSEAQQVLRVPGEAMVGSEAGARLALHNLVVDLRTGQFTVSSMKGGVTP